MPGHDDIEVIREWHTSPDPNDASKPWSDVGYHYFVTSDGRVQQGRDEDVAGAHCRGENGDSIGICLHGKETFTPDQFSTLAMLLYDLLNKYHLNTSDIYGHNHFDHRKTCPNYDVGEVRGLVDMLLA